MSCADQEQTYDFDVALSFAGEDREYVKELVQSLAEQGIRSFYDEDHLAEMWGENLYEFLDEVYRRRARYAVLFVSRHYVEKSWPRRERQSAQARAVEEKLAYVLPVRLDDSELPGLLPSVSYLDARRIGIPGIVNALVRKLAASKAGLAKAPLAWDGKVPRSQSHIQQLLDERPPGWEYLLFGAYLVQFRSEHENKYRDHEVGHSVSGDHIGLLEGAPFLARSFAEARAIASRLEPLLGQQVREASFGRPGESGNPDRIEHMARRLMGLYEDCLDWAARMRGTTTSEQAFTRALVLASQFMDASIEEFREFTDRAVTELDRIPAAIADDDPLRLDLQLTLTIPDALVDEFLAEMDRLGIEYSR